MLKAVEEDKPSVVRQLMKKMTDEKDGLGDTALHIAAERGQTDVCRAILNSHVHEEDPTDTWGWTPLHVAAFEGHTEICRAILEVVEDKAPLDNDGITPLQVARDA